MSDASFLISCGGLPSRRVLTDNSFFERYIVLTYSYVAVAIRKEVLPLELRFSTDSIPPAQGVTLLFIDDILVSGFPDKSISFPLFFGRVLEASARKPPFVLQWSNARVLSV